MTATAGAMNLVKLTSVSYANVDGTETSAPSTLKQFLASEIQQGKFNFDDPAVSTTQEYAADGTTYRSREGNATTSASLSLHSVTLERASEFLKGTFAAGVSGTTPASIKTIGNEIVSNKYIKIVGLNNSNQIVTYTFANAKITTSQSGNIDQAQETVPLLIKCEGLLHSGLGYTIERDVAY